MRMRKKKNLVPRMEACDACWIRRPEEHRGRWRELMPGARELRVELGCGKGRFTAETAKAEPGRAAHRGGEGAGRDGRGDGARAGRGADQRVFHRRRRGAPAGAVRPRRGGPDLHQLLRPVAAEQPEKAPPDTRKLPGASTAGCCARRDRSTSRPTTTSSSRGRSRRFRSSAFPSRRSRRICTRTALSA